jgi:hypothetical protein
VRSAILVLLKDFFIMRFGNMSPEFISELLALIEDGCPITTALDCMGIPEPTYYYWIRNADDPDHPEYGEFAKKIKEAKAKFISSCVKHIRVAAPKNWQAAAWLLERKKPESYSEKYLAKKYDEELANFPLERQGNEIFRRMLRGELSAHEANTFVQILANKAKVEENVELKKQLFEIEQKLK